MDHVQGDGAAEGDHRSGCGFGKHDAVAGFFATVPANGRLERIRLVLTRANGHPTLAAYLPDDQGWECRGYGIMVLTITGDQVATITGFPDPDLFPLFDLPTTAP